MILITFAVPQESRGVVTRCRRAAGMSELGGQKVAVLHTGMGGPAAEKAVRKAIEDLRPEWVLSSGFAGGLDPRFHPGALLAAANFSSSSLLAGLPPEIARVAISSTDLPLDTPAAKSAHFAQTGAGAVDLESASIAAVCQSLGIPLLVLRLVSDAAYEALPLPSSVTYDFVRQRIRHPAIAWYLATHPQRIPALTRFVRQLPGWQEKLAAALEAVVQKAPQP